MIGQIHDSLVVDLVPEEEEYLIENVNRIMTEKVKEEFDWIIVPLVAEFELTGIDEAWYYKKAI